ncbi:MAG: hypothetical protein GY765_01115, partial [bacterium]|nr:hypothetical protein [bacterium]
YPLLKDYRVTRDKVYAISNKAVDGKYVTYVFDHSGKLEGKVQLPLKALDKLEGYPFAIYDNHLYQLTETEDEESWQLEITKIK